MIPFLIAPHIHTDTRFNIWRLSITITVIFFSPHFNINVEKEDKYRKNLDGTWSSRTRSQILLQVCPCLCMKIWITLLFALRLHLQFKAKVMMSFFLKIYLFLFLFMYECLHICIPHSWLPPPEAGIRNWILLKTLLGFSMWVLRTEAGFS